ncbi:hypothetical protein ACFQZQ_03160 [Lysobacter koreensis]|uniref:Uncharacterized protein n=1 Tax=Lysobacter koreensis TaxID=266122 RepID=A0ABW2YLD9_9GAMM
MSKYRALRLLGFDPISAMFVAAISCAVQPANRITILNVDIEISP